jgi:hypothetical protein
MGKSVHCVQLPFSSAARRIETAFTPGEVLLVAEAAGVPGGGTAESSYSIAGGGPLQLISGSVPTQGAAACLATYFREMPIS